MSVVMECHDLTKKYGDLMAVKGITLSVNEGEVLGLLGPNGAGKSTALGMLTCLFPPTSGRAAVFGKDVVAQAAEVKRLIGVVPQDIALYPTLSARDNLKFFGEMFGLGGRALKDYYPAKPGRLRYLEKHEAKRLIHTAGQLRSPYLADFIELALNTGARKNELLQLQSKSIDLPRKIITIEAHTTKTGKRRYLPINQAAAQAITQRHDYKQTHCPDSPWLFTKRKGDRIKYPDKAFNIATKAANIEDFTIHDLRHTFASWLVTEGIELIKVRDLLGHSSIRMTERYAHLAPHRLHEAVSVLDGFYQAELDLD